METCSALLASVWGFHRSPVNSPHKGQWRGTLLFSLIYVSTNELGKQSRRRWFETASRSLWRHCNISVLIVYLTFYPLADVTNYLSMQMAYGILVSCELYMSEAPTPKNFMYTAPARQIKVSRITNEVMIHDGVSKWKHFPRYWPFVRGIHRWLVDSPYKGQ